jgi:hypothetical protein
VNCFECEKVHLYAATLHLDCVPLGLSAARLLILASHLSMLQAKAVGEFATVTTVDARRGTATLQTQGGETFTLPKDSSWTVGTRVLCDRVSDGTPHYLERCLVWQ